MFKKVLALMLALVMALTFAACNGKEESETTTTTNAAVDADATTDALGEDSADENGETVDPEETEENTDSEITEADGKTTKKSDSKTTTKKSDGKTTTQKTDSKTTTKKSDGKTTTKKTDSKTTTKTTTAKKTLQVPSGVKDIVNAYKNAANKTKAQDNMKVDKTCDVDINIKSIAGMEWLAKIANPIATKYMSQANGTVEKEVFVNGKPTKKTEKNDKGQFVNDKSTFIPIYGSDKMCTLDYNNVKSATVTKKTNSTYDVKIVLKDDKCSITSTPKITVSGMDYFNPNLYDLGDFRFAKGTVYYTNCVITATIDADGYLDYVKHDMSLKTDDTILAYKSAETKNPSALEGKYVTTFKFY